MESNDMAVKSRGKRVLALIKGAYRKYEEDAFPFGLRIEHPYDMMRTLGLITWAVTEDANRQREKASTPELLIDGYPRIHLQAAIVAGCAMQIVEALMEYADGDTK